MNGSLRESVFGDLYFCATILARNQETIELEQSMQIDDLFERALSMKGQIRGLGHCVNDLSEIVLEQSVQIERLRGEFDRLWSVINDQTDGKYIKEKRDQETSEKTN